MLALATTTRARWIAPLVGFACLAVLLAVALAAPAPAFADPYCESCHKAGGSGLNPAFHPVPDPKPAPDYDGQCTVCHEITEDLVPDYHHPPYGPYPVTGANPDHAAGVYDSWCYDCHGGTIHGQSFGSGTPLTGTINVVGSDCAGCHTSGMNADVPQIVQASHPDPTAAHAAAVTPACVECHGSDLAALHVSCVSCHSPDPPTGATCVTCHQDKTESHGMYAGFSASGQYLPWATALRLGAQNSDAALMARGPHSGYATTTIKCVVCHSVHRGGNQLLTEGTTCAYCHSPVAEGGGAVASNLVSWYTPSGGPHSSCAATYCHGGPHGVGASAYDGPASRLLTNLADAELDKLATANAVATSELATYSATTRALATAAVCQRDGCHSNSMFGVIRAGSLESGMDGTKSVTGHRVIAAATTNWNANGTDFPSTRTNLSIAFKPVSYCSSCHDLVDDNNGGKAAFPHGLSGVVSVSQGADGTTRPAVWLTAAANAGETGQIVGPYNRYAGDGATVAGAAGSSVLDGVCLKCHRSADGLHGIGIDDGAPLAPPAPVDSTPPAGTMSVNGGAENARAIAATIDSSLSDAGSGMSQMQIDPGTGAYGPLMAYAPSQGFTLASGDGIKTVRVRYTDGAGNALVLTDTITLDIVAPVTVSNILSGATYSGGQAFTLTPGDGGSGVAGTWWQLDGTAGAWTSGTSVPVVAPLFGSVSHTLYWYSTDAAGNQEVTKSVTFSVSAPAVATATLAFVWHPGGYAEADLRVEDASGATIASQHLSGYGTALDWYVTVLAGQNYRMVVDYYYDDDNADEGGGYWVWSNDTVSNWGDPLNPDGFLSSSETVTWYY